MRYPPGIAADRRHGLLALWLAGDLACGGSSVVCPQGTVADEVRARTVAAVADGTRAGRGLAGVDAKVCFGGLTRGTVRHDGVVVIGDGLEGEAAAARMIHLRMHVGDGLHRFPEVGVACERQIEAAIAAEARAIVAEIEACDELRCAAAPYSFAAAVLAMAADQRVSQVMGILRAEPVEDGLRALIGGYRARCDAANR
jgi:hypothetical protein